MLKSCNSKKGYISNGVKGIFVSGTDTGVGKSLICGLLGRYFLNQGYKVITQKWIQTGGRSFSSDINTHLKLMRVGKLLLENYASLICPYVFKLPASPHLAALNERVRIRKSKIKKGFNTLKKDFDYIIVEGIGGVLVPFSKKELVIDIVRDLKLPALIVAANKLGAINHTLLTIEALRARKIKILGLIFNNARPKEKKIILKDNPQIIKAISKEKTLGILPYSKNKNLLYKKFIPLGKKILKMITEIRK